MVEDEELLLELLNSAPVEDGHVLERLDGEGGKAFSARHGGTGTPAELRFLRRMRGCLQDAVRGVPGAPGRLQRELDGVGLVPVVEDTGGTISEDTGGTISWVLRAPDEQVLAARAALAWSRLAEALPGRLRPCANAECNLFLIDRSRPGTAKWCSMAACGNRMKARAHAARRRDGQSQR